MLFFAYIILYFCIYSILGWICETIFCYITNEKGKRGFLSGPYCPIYGVGGVLICYLLIPFTANFLLIFVLSALIASVLEYFTGYVLETAFEQKWWDYSHRKYNLKGRVCLGNSILFGIMGVIDVYFIHPIIVDIVANLGNVYVLIFAIIVSIMFIYDTIMTLNKLQGDEMTNLTPE